MLHAAVRHNVYLIEECLAERPLGAIVMIFDMGSHDADADAVPSDHALDRASITSFLGLLAPILAKHYPLVLEALFVVRSPADDGWLRKLTASLEPAVDQAHAHIVPAGAQNTLGALTASVPLEAIPTFLGGTREVRGGCARDDGRSSHRDARRRVRVTIPRPLAQASGDTPPLPEGGKLVAQSPVDALCRHLPPWRLNAAVPIQSPMPDALLRRPSAGGSSSRATSDDSSLISSPTSSATIASAPPLLCRDDAGSRSPPTAPTDAAAPAGAAMPSYRRRSPPL